MITEPGNHLLRDDPFAPVAPTSTPIQRYDFTLDGMEKCSLDGLFITHDDHLAAIAEARAEGARMMLEAAHKACEAVEEDHQQRYSREYPECRPDSQAGAQECADAIRAIDIEAVLKG